MFKHKTDEELTKSLSELNLNGNINKFVENSKLLKRMIEDNMFEDQTDEEIIQFFKNDGKFDFNIIEQFFNNNFDFTESQLLKLINCFNFFDNINLICSIVLYKIGEYNIDKLYFIPEKIFKWN